MLFPTIEPPVPEAEEDVARGDHEELPLLGSRVQEPVRHEYEGEEDGEIDGRKQHPRLPRFVLWAPASLARMAPRGGLDEDPADRRRTPRGKWAHGSAAVQTPASRTGRRERDASPRVVHRGPARGS